MAGYVYLIQVVGHDYYKVGVTQKDPYKRLSELQTAAPFQLEVVDAVYYHDPHLVEGILHAALKTYRVRNEWFIGRDRIIHQLFRLYSQLATILLDSIGDVAPEHVPEDSSPELPNSSFATLEADIVRRLNQKGYGKIAIIELVWGVKPGGSSTYKAAAEAYEKIINGTRQ